VTFTATVSAASGGPATGTIAFKVGATAITGCTAVALSSGVATCTTPAGSPLPAADAVGVSGGHDPVN
jgi:hypothetical protein